MTFKFNLGSKVRDLLTGFTGAVTGRCEWVSGCLQYIVQPSVDKDGKLPDSIWLDEPRLEVIEERQIQSRQTGGPQSIPSRVG